MSDPVAHLEAVIARYATAQGSASTVPTAVDYQRPARDPATGEIVPRPAVSRGGDEHLRDLTYALLGALGEIRRLRGRVELLEQTSHTHENDLCALEERIEALEDKMGRLWAPAEDEAREADQTDATVATQGRLIAVLALAVGGLAGLCALALGLAGSLWWRLL